MSVDGDKACFFGRGGKHEEHAKSLDQMRHHPLYRDYLAKGAKILALVRVIFQIWTCIVG